MKFVCKDTLDIRYGEAQKSKALTNPQSLFELCMFQAGMSKRHFAEQFKHTQGTMSNLFIRCSVRVESCDYSEPDRSILISIFAIALSLNPMKHVISFFFVFKECPFSESNSLYN